jgi:peroxiredoxin
MDGLYGMSKTGICDFGWQARDFKLKGVDGKSYELADVRGPKGTLVVFICNRCPYVKASIDRIVAEAKALREIGIGTISIMPNDTATYREDSFDNMKAFAAFRAAFQGQALRALMGSISKSGGHERWASGSE